MIDRNDVNVSGWLIFRYFEASNPKVYNELTSWRPEADKKFGHVPQRALDPGD